MTTLLRMEEDQSHMTERIFNLTLEIICLLTGERFPPVKSGDHVTITVPPPHSGRHNKEKILEITRKMMELLIGEVPERCQDVTVCSSMEGCQYIEGHKDLYKDTMMENMPPFTSTDVSSDRNPPERCTGPLCSLQCLQEDPAIPRHYQDGELIQGNDVVKEEEEETYVRSDQQCMEEAMSFSTSLCEYEYTVPLLNTMPTSYNLASTRLDDFQTQFPFSIKVLPSRRQFKWQGLPSAASRSIQVPVFVTVCRLTVYHASLRMDASAAPRVQRVGHAHIRVTPTNVSFVSVMTLWLGDSGNTLFLLKT
ncbi:uncharacterized protein [Hyperolius riggenbachi]|uniref:uncharacterized protein n=1 Tax=Hyperolius riggenbachi TaxID=752182 RepID=UPI0035A2EA8E